jgi:hypothetical protein
MNRSPGVLGKMADVLDEIVDVPLVHVKSARVMRADLDLPIDPYLYPVFR